MGDTGWGIVFVLGLTTAVTVVVVWQLFKTWQIRATVGTGATHDEEYRTIANRVAAVGQQTAQESWRGDATAGERDEAEEGR